ncbi:MAG: hypothetical protein ACKV0T_06230 [Planctomycetales bacterium]
MLTQSELIQKELKLTPEQVEKLTALDDAFREGTSERNRRRRRISSKADLDAMRDVERVYLDDYNREAEAVLDAGQRKRIHEIAVQVNTISVNLQNPEIVKALNISDEQIEQFKLLNEVSTKQINERLQRGGDSVEIHKDVQELSKIADSKVAALLSNEQKAQLERLKGTKFDFDPATLSPRTGRVDASAGRGPVANSVELAGRVVYQSGRQHGVPQAIVSGRSLTDDREQRFGTNGKFVSDADGRFKTRRSPVRMLVQAYTPDGFLAGFAPVGADDAEVVISVGLAATARGRLIDRESGRPIPDQTMFAQLEVAAARGRAPIRLYGNKAVTNVLGEFTLAGLIPGQTYSIALGASFGPDGRPRGNSTPADVLAETAGIVDVGDIQGSLKVDESLTLEDLIEGAMLSRDPLDKVFMTRLNEARRGRQQVLLFAVERKADLCSAFFEDYFSFSKGTEQNMLRRTLTNFALLPIDITEGKPADAATPLFERLKLTAPAANDALFAILDQDGGVLASARAHDLSSAGRLDDGGLTKFLEAQRPPIPDARERFAAALVEAKRDSRRVVAIHVAQFSAPSELLSRYVERWAALLKKDFAVVKIDSTFIGSNKLIESLGGKAGDVEERPWMVIVDSDGKPLITSAGPSGNIGFPMNPGEIAHFEKMIRTTAQRLTDAEIDMLLKGLLELD